MDERELQDREIERLQKKVADLSSAYQQAILELNQLKKESKKTQSKGRPSLELEKKTRILSLYRSRKTMREIAHQEQVALGTVQKIVSKASKQARVVYVFSDKELPGTIIDVDYFLEKIRIENLTDAIMSRAFGIKEKPDWEDYQYFLESRCMPRTRYGIRDELKYMEIDVYDPFQIIQITKGRVHGDHQYLLSMSCEWIQKYDLIRKKEKNSAVRKEELRKFMKQSEKEWKLDEDQY